jgi:glycine oxidase
MIPAAGSAAGHHPTEQLRALASKLHPQWAEELQGLTGIDNGYRRCGALQLATTSGEAAALAAWAGLMHEEGVEVRRLALPELRELEPGLIGRRQSDSPAAAYLVPGVAQIRNPWHLHALVAACRQESVVITPNLTVNKFIIEGNRLAGLETSSGRLTARQFCVTAGAWTGPLLQRLRIATGILPIRGQMVLFRCQRPPITRIVEEGSRYLVPRGDGHVLAGSTEEEVGFDKRTTEEAIADLTAFARRICPLLADATVEKTWAGLRPGSFDGLPYMGRLPGLSNAFVAAGHFRTGLYLSPASAIVMRQLMRGVQPEVDLSPFRVGR